MATEANNDSLMLITLSERSHKNVQWSKTDMEYRGILPQAALVLSSHATYHDNIRQYIPELLSMED